jgi:hypothetical protein
MTGCGCRPHRVSRCDETSPLCCPIGRHYRPDPGPFTQKLFVEVRHSEAGDVQALGREAHKLAGTAGTLGAGLPGMEARSLDEACRSGPADAARVLEVGKLTLETFRSLFSSQRNDETGRA